MITSVTLKNFRGLHDATIPLTRVTMLTGGNGVGKTSVLEGLYCLFSETRLDVSPLARYERTLGRLDVQSLTSRRHGGARGCDYALFWDECPTFGEDSCGVSARSEDDTAWSWTCTRAKMAELDDEMLKEAGRTNLADSATNLAVFAWERCSGSPNGQPTVERMTKAQIPDADGALYLFPNRTNTMRSLCTYVDFTAVRSSARRLSFQNARKLTGALKLINPRITDVRITNADNGLSVVWDASMEATLGTVGTGAVGWANTMITILNAIDEFRSTPKENTPVLVLIDEMGAGIHYGVMGAIWKYFRDFAHELPDTQFVITSHSDDCVGAFCEVFAEDGDAASIVRMHNTYDGELVTTQYTQRTFDNIMKGDWEVRG